LEVTVNQGGTAEAMPFVLSAASSPTTRVAASGLGREQLRQVAKAKQFLDPLGQVDQFELAISFSQR
jgi:hypothetical protein